MSIKSDYDEVRALWTNASVLTRGVLLLSLFLTISSVTSLSEEIFKWRGFILEGVEFYRTIRKPIADLLSFASISEQVVDLLIPATIWLGIYFRTDIGDPPDARWTRSSYGLRLLVAVIIGAVGGSCLSRFAPDHFSFGVLTMALVVFAPFLELSRRERIAYWTYVGIVFMCLFVLAAVNAGLTRPS